MRLLLEEKKLSPGVGLPVQVQSISPYGLVVLTADQTPPGLDSHVLDERIQGGENLTFRLEKDGGCVTVEGSLVWFELSGAHQDRRRLELIVDMGGGPGWREVQAALKGK